MNVDGKVLKQWSICFVFSCPSSSERNKTRSLFLIENRVAELLAFFFNFNIAAFNYLIHKFICNKKNLYIHGYTVEY